MLKEINRIQWNVLIGRPGSDPAKLKDAILCLANSTDQDKAVSCYWQIDGCAFDQERIYPAALPVAQLLLEVLQICSSVARPQVLELLSQMSARTGSDKLGQDCKRELFVGLPLFIHWLEVGTREEMSLCVDALFLLALEFHFLKDRIVWLLEETRLSVDDRNFQELISNCIFQLRSARQE